MKKHWIKKCCMILTCLYLTGCGREEVPYLDTTQTQEQTVETERTEQKETLKSDQTVQVYVCGEVAAPGVYQLKDGMRICDAVEAAGGLTKAASREYWNLAEKLSDGQMIYFPTEEEARERKASAEAAGATVEESDGRIDINTADATQLVTIPGIGELSPSAAATTAAPRCSGMPARTQASPPVRRGSAPPITTRPSTPLPKWTPRIPSAAFTKRWWPCARKCRSSVREKSSSCTPTTRIC